MAYQLVDFRALMHCTNGRTHTEKKKITFVNVSSLCGGLKQTEKRSLNEEV